MKGFTIHFPDNWRLPECANLILDAAKEIDSASSDWAVANHADLPNDECVAVLTTKDDVTKESLNKTFESVSWFSAVLEMPQEHVPFYAKNLDLKL